MPRAPRLIAAAFVFALLAASARADTVVCFDGRSFEGEVLEDNEQTVRIRTAAGTVTLKKNEVRSVVYRESPLQAFAKRRAALASDDAKGRYELAQYCKENGLKREAEVLLEETLSMASPYFKKATKELAQIVKDKDPKRAVELLDALAEKANDAEARVMARDIKRGLDSKRQSAYDEALEQLKQKHTEGAIETLRFAWALSYIGRGAGGGSRVSQAEILAKLAEIRRDLETATRKRLGRKVAAEEGEAPAAPAVDVTCSRCPNHSGWRTCHQCNGKGEVDHIIPERITASGVIPAKRVIIPCPTCTGGKMARCPECAGSGLELSKLDFRIRGTVKRIADAAWERRNDDPSRALKDAYATVVRDRLRLPDGLEHGYPTTKKLRELLPAAPVAENYARSAEYAKLAAAWRNTPQHERGQFLCAYAFECSKNALPTAGASGTVDEKPVDVPDAEKVDLAKIRLTAPTVSATELSALPENWAGKWVWVSGAYRGVDETLSGKDRRTLLLDAGQIHNLHPFVFVTDALPAHTAAAAERGAPPFLAMLVHNYPYRALTEKSGALNENDFLQMFGRVLYRKDRDPETSLEVWHFDIHIPPEVLELLTLVRKPVTFNFEDTPLSEAAELLMLLTATNIRVEVPKEAEPALSGRATQAPLAFALHDLLKKSELDWVFDAKQKALRIVQKPGEEERKDREHVLRHLK